MALTVENGTGLTNADSFVSVADAITYHTDRGNTDWTDAVTNDQEIALRRATDYLTQGFTWDGTKINGRDQALAFPRNNLVDAEGFEVPNDEVPREVEDATCELALRELQTPGSLNPDVVPANNVEMEKVGEISVTYSNARTDADAYKPVVNVALDLIAGFLAAGSGQNYVGSSYRA